MPRSGSSTARYGGKRVKEEQADDGTIPPSTTSSSRRTGSSKQHKDEEQIELENDDNDNDEDEDENGVTRCVCGSNGEEDGFMIQCETCKAWQHGLCLGYHSEKDCPETYYCERCRPDLHVDLLKRLKKTRNVSVASTKSDAPKRIAVADRTILVPRSSSSRSPSPVPKPKSPKRRSTMNSRDAAYDIALAISESRLRDAERSERGRSERGGSEAGNDDGPKRKRKRSASRSASRAMSTQPSNKRARSASSASLAAHDQEDAAETMQVDDEDEDGSTAKRKSSSSTTSVKGKATSKGPKTKRAKAGPRRKSGVGKRKSDSPVDPDPDEDDAAPEPEGEEDAEQGDTAKNQNSEPANDNEDDVEAAEEGEEEIDNDDDTPQVKRLNKKASRPKLSHTASSSSRKVAADETPTTTKRPRPPASTADSENSSTLPSTSGTKTKGGKGKAGGAKGTRTPAKGTTGAKAGMGSDKSTPVPNGASAGGATSTSKPDKIPPKSSGKGRANNPRGINGSAKQREAEKERERMERERDRIDRGEISAPPVSAVGGGMERSRADSPSSPSLSPNQYWSLPDHLSHLAHILPQPSPSSSTAPTSNTGRKTQKYSDEEPPSGPPLSSSFTSLHALASASYAYSYSSPIKVKWPGKRITIGDMNKRVRSIMEFVGREQGAAVLRQRRVEALEQARERWLAENGGKLPPIPFEGGGGSSRGSSAGVRGKGGRNSKAAQMQLDEPKPAQLPELPAPPLPTDDEPPQLSASSAPNGLPLPDHPILSREDKDGTLMDVDTPGGGGSADIPHPYEDDAAGAAKLDGLVGQGLDGGDVTLKKEVTTAQVPMSIDPTSPPSAAGLAEAGHHLSMVLAEVEAGDESLTSLTTVFTDGPTDTALPISAISSAATTMQAMAELMQDLLIFQEKFRPRERRRGDALS